MSRTKRSERNTEKSLFKKSHVHKPKKGKGGYKRKGRRNFKQKQIDDILEDEFE